MKKALSVGLIVAVVALVAVGANARGWGRGNGGYGMGGPGYNMPPAAQEDYAKFMKDTLAERQQIAAKMVELRSLFAEVKPDQAKIDALRDEVYNLRKALAEKADKAGIRSGGYGMRGRGYANGPRRGQGPRGGYGMGGAYCGPDQGYSGGGYGYGPRGGYGMRGGNAGPNRGSGYGYGSRGRWGQGAGCAWF